MQDELILGNNRHSNVKNTLLTVFLCIVIVFALFRILFNAIYLKVYVVGDSMEATLKGAYDTRYSGGDYVYAFKSQNPRHGDIVVVKTQSKNIIKRVVALGGDWVELKEGVLYLNDEAQPEPYVLAENNTPSENNYDRVQVPQGCVFCLGDNRDNSNDSRSEQYGFIDLNSIIGIVADWSLSFKGVITSVNTFFDYTLPQAMKS